MRTYFGKLGLSAEIADLYMALQAEGPQTISELARNSGVERTRIYRLVEQLGDSGLIETETRGQRTLLKPAPIAGLRTLIARKELELRSLHDELDLISQAMSSTQLSSPVLRTQYFAGKSGAQQMLQHEIVAGLPVVGMSTRLLQDAVGGTFLRQIQAQYAERPYRIQLLCNDTKLAPKLQRECTPANARAAGVQKSDVQYITVETFKITQMWRVCGDTFALWQWHAGNFFGTELHSAELAETQRQFFTTLWDRANSHAS